MPVEMVLFEHSSFDVYSFETIPLDRDLFLVEDTYLQEYRDSMLRCFGGEEYDVVGYVSYVAARKILNESIELSWFANINTRFHELVVYLPKEAFVACVGSWRFDDKPHVFVKADWLRQLHLRRFAAFALIDAIGVKEALLMNKVTRDGLLQLRERIDQIATNHPDVSFVSFADSLLLKGNWSVGLFDSPVRYSYAPENFLRIIEELQAAYRDVLGLEIYGIFTQGANEYHADNGLHISPSGNHLSLNSLGIPFAELLAIDAAVATALKSKTHNPAQLYVDAKFLHSLRFRFDFERDGLTKSSYRGRMTSTDGLYYLASVRTILDNLRNETDDA